jgi:hypothetical protein
MHSRIPPETTRNNALRFEAGAPPTFMNLNRRSKDSVLRLFPLRLPVNTILLSEMNWGKIPQWWVKVRKSTTI